jgi:hypothetical protein
MTFKGHGEQGKRHKILDVSNIKTETEDYEMSCLREYKLQTEDV